METRSSDLNEKQINPICALFSLHLPKKSTEESGKVLQSLRSFTVGSCSEENGTTHSCTWEQWSCFPYSPQYQTLALKEHLWKMAAHSNMCTASSDKNPYISFFFFPHKVKAHVIYVESKVDSAKRISGGSPLCFVKSADTFSCLPHLQESQ